MQTPITTPPVSIPPPIPDPMSIPAPVPVAAATSTPSPPSSGFGFGNWFLIGIFVSAVILLIIIIVMGRSMGLFRETPKENFEVQSGPEPSSNTKDSYAIFPKL